MLFRSKDGVFVGENIYTRTPLFIDFFDRNMLDNSNVSVFGKSGSGKTYTVSVITIRSVYKGIRSVIIDPEGDYSLLTKSLGGAHVIISTESPDRLNPFDLEEEEILDDRDRPTGKFEVRIKDKVSDVLNLIGVMANGLTREQESIVSTTIADLYRKFGFTENPESLYDNTPIFDKATNVFVHSGRKKLMPTFSDFHDAFSDYATEEKNRELISLSNALKIFKKGGVYDLFDCQTNINVDFNKAPIVCFNVRDLEESILRPIGMYISMTWAWEKFVKKNPHIKKMVLLDEAWMFVNKNMAGHEYTSAFLEKAARRIRKRNAGLMISSQDYMSFAESAQGRAAINNTTVNILLKQDASYIDEMQKAFRLSDGEREFLLTAKRGEFLVRMNGESSVAQTIAFEEEHAVITKKDKT